jgi:hypothetical protein
MHDISRLFGFRVSIDRSRVCSFGRLTRALITGLSSPVLSASANRSVSPVAFLAPRHYADISRLRHHASSAIISRQTAPPGIPVDIFCISRSAAMKQLLELECLQRNTGTITLEGGMAEGPRGGMGFRVPS